MSLTFKAGLKPLSLIFWVSSILLLSVLGYNGYQFILQKAEIETHQQIRKEIAILQQRKQTEFDHIIQKLQQTTLFMSRLPPIQDIIQASLDSEQNTSNATNLAPARRQLQEIYQSYLISDPAIFQARFIRYDSQGMEWVRVERSPGQKTVIITPDHKLQSKAGRDYFQKARSLPPGVLGFSDINLNREHGVIEFPHRPTIRCYISVFTPDGTPFGMIAINYDMTAFLTQFAISSIDDYRIYLTDKSGHILLSPEPKQAFQYEWDNTAPHWQDLFQPIEPDRPNTDFKLPLYSYSVNGEQATVFESRLIHSLLSDLQHYTLLVAIPSSYLKYQQDQKARYPLLTFVFFIVCIILCLLILTVILNKRYTGQIRMLNRQLENQVENRTQELKSALQDKNFLFNAIQHQLIYSETTLNGKITEVNDLFCQICGYTRDTIIGKTHHFLSSGEHPASFWQDLWATINSGQNWRGIICNRHKNGHFFWTDTLIFPIFNATGELTKYVSFRVDITEIINSRQCMEDAKQLAESASQAKTNFLTNISHEIRTPLNVIMGMNYLLNETPLDKNQKELLQTINIASKNLFALINDLLDFSKIEAGQLTLEYTPFSLNQLLEELRLMFKNLLDPHQQKLLIHLTPDIPDALISDSSRLKQMLINLLNNAIKFTPEGQITLTVTLMDSKPSNDTLRLRFTVQDTGIGIDPAIQNQLFQPFVQAESSSSKRFGGTGLGLSIVKQLTSLMDGHVGFASELGKGSTFWIELPLKLADETLFKDSENHFHSSLQLLIGIAEDSILQQVSDWSESFDWHSTLFNKPSELLLQAVLRVHKNRPIHGIIIDAAMIETEPSLPFYSLKHPTTDQPIPYLILASDSERQNLLKVPTELDPSKIVPKPANACELFNRLNETLIRSGQSFNFLLKQTHLISADFLWLAGVKILAVDDSLMNLKFIQKLLVKEGAEPTLCESGHAALEVLKSSDTFDACLMDLQMPIMDGCETTQKIRQTLGLTELPIIAVTAGATTHERNKAFDAGMNDFLTKPLAPFDLVQILRHLIQQRRNQPLPLQPRLPSSNESHKNENDWPDITGIDIPNAKKRLSDDLDLFTRSLHRFCNESPLEGLPSKTPNGSNERQNLAHELHKIAGNTGLIGANDIYQLSKELETTLLNDESAQIDESLEELHRQIQNLIDSARLFLAQSPVREDMNQTVPNKELDWLQLETLRQHLTQKRIQSLSLFESMAPALQNHLQPEQFTDLQQTLDQLDFSSALKILSNLNMPSKD